MNTLAIVGALTLAHLVIKRAEQMYDEGRFGTSGAYYLIALLCMFYIGFKAYSEVIA